MRPTYLLFAAALSLPSCALDGAHDTDWAADNAEEAKRRALLQARQQSARTEVAARTDLERQAAYVRIAGIRQASGFGRPKSDRVWLADGPLPSVVPALPHTDKYSSGEGVPLAKAYSGTAGASAVAEATIDAAALASAPIPKITVWESMRYYYQGYRFLPYGYTAWQDYKTVSFRWAVRATPEHLQIHTDTFSSDNARAAAEVRREHVLAYAEATDGGEARAEASVVPRPDHPVHVEKRTRVSVCNDLAVREAIHVVFGFRRETDRRDAWRQTTGPFVVLPGKCTRWYPEFGLVGYEVFVRAHAAWTDEAGRHTLSWGDSPRMFCAVADLVSGPVSRWSGYGAPTECVPGLARVPFTQLPTDTYQDEGDGRWHVEFRATEENSLGR